MTDVGGSVTLIFYKIESPWNEPFLNILAAAAQLSCFTHVEIAIGARLAQSTALPADCDLRLSFRAGDEAGQMGQMSNVCRIFNDSVGVELTSRTGRNPQARAPARAGTALAQRVGTPSVAPQYSYLSVGCSKRAENAMLAYARTLVGKPFSNVGMARSIFFPRQTDGESFFCAGESRARLSETPAKHARQTRTSSAR